LGAVQESAFRWLWIGVLISWTGTWMQTVGAQWLVVDAPNAPALVSLVQAATTLPVMLLALPGGVLADSFDRRWLLFAIQIYFFGVGVLSPYSPPLGKCRRPCSSPLPSFSALGQRYNCPRGRLPFPSWYQERSCGRPPGSIWSA
jgi:MFS family permease